MLPIEKVKYNKNFLSKVIFRLDFLPILKIQKEISPEFQDEIRSDLPTFTELKATEYITKISAEKKEDETKIVSQWFFSDLENRFKLTLTSDFIAIEDYKYTSLSDYTKIIEKVIKSFTKFYKDITFKRIGLRFINEIVFSEGDPLKWSDYIADSLVCSIEDFIGDNKELSRAMSQFIIKKDDCSIIFNFGIFNSIFPDKISRKEFILDYDCHSKDVDISNIVGQIKHLNILILDLFELSIKNSLRSNMGVKNEK